MSVGGFVKLFNLFELKILWFLLDCRVYSTFSHPWARYDCLPELSRALLPSRGDQIILDSRLHLEDSGEFLFFLNYSHALAGL